MDKMIFFLKILAWIFGVFSLLAIIACIYLNKVYPGSFDELLDKLNGQRREYPTSKWVIIFIICSAFLMAFW